MSRAKIERFIQREEARPTWNIKELNEEERNSLKNNLIISMIDNEEDYQAVIGYMYRKYPFEMDGLKTPETGKENVSIQWNYRPSNNKLNIFNSKTNKEQDMYAFVVYDKERDMEPIAFAGSYFKLTSSFVKSFDTTEEMQNDKNINLKYLMDGFGSFDNSGKYQAFGQGYVMFVDPNYRRLGLATDLWFAEAQLYREALKIRYQREIQNEYSLISTQNMFSDPSKCIITSPGRVKNDGTRCQIRVLLDYEDDELKNNFKSMLPGLKTIYNKPNWTFLEKENISKEALTKYWKK